MESSKLFLLLLFIDATASLPVTVNYLLHGGKLLPFKAIIENLGDETMKTDLVNRLGTLANEANGLETKLSIASDRAERAEKKADEHFKRAEKAENEKDNANAKLIEQDGITILRTHLEISEGLYLASFPMPKTLDEYKKKFEERKLQINKDIEQAIEEESKAEIVWPKTMDIELKDAIEKKVNKHYRIWIWILYYVNAPEITALRESVGNDVVGIRRLASGFAGLYIYANSEIRSRDNYSKETLRKYTLPKLKQPLVRFAADLILENLWVD